MNSNKKKNSNLLQKLGIEENEKSKLKNFNKCLQNNCFLQVQNVLKSFAGVNRSIIEKILKTNKINKSDINKFNKNFVSLENALLGDEFIKCVKDKCNGQNYKDKLKSLSIKIDIFINNKNGNSKSIENQFTIDILRKFNSFILRFIEKLEG